MIAKETDDEDIPAQRLVCSLWARATSARFATTFHEVAFELSTIGVAKMVEVCKNPYLGPYIRTLIVIVDLKRRIAATFYEFHD
jgi:hypothetical protein